jgi:hypothetical protein
MMVGSVQGDEIEPERFRLALQGIKKPAVRHVVV